MSFPLFQHFSLPTKRTTTSISVVSNHAAFSNLGPRSNHTEDHVDAQVVWPGSRRGVQLCRNFQPLAATEPRDEGAGGLIRDASRPGSQPDGQTEIHHFGTSADRIPPPEPCRNHVWRFDSGTHAVSRGFLLSLCAYLFNQHSHLLLDYWMPQSC